MSDDIVETDLFVARAALLKARNVIDDNADKDDPTGDALALRRVYSLVLDALAPVSGALAVVRQRRELTAVVLEQADTERPPMRVCT